MYVMGLDFSGLLWNSDIHFWEKKQKMYVGMENDSSKKLRKAYFFINFEKKY